MSVIKDLDHLKISFQDIKVATNFTTVIGEGGYGPVYAGKLSISGNLTSVAVKRLPNKSLSGQGLKEFLTEIHLLSRYKHPNLVSLIGYCEEDDEKILIYEYAEHGSFDKFLETTASCPLTWKQRIKICIDAARGLDYLHNGVGANHRVIHRDIKSSNILLDHNWKAMIADLGLSKLGRANECVTYLITNPGGTPAYCDPEYVKTGILTKKSDVYSFGVVLFEALCGRLCLMNVIGEKRFLVPLARRCYREGRLKEIMDLDLKDSESVVVFSEIAYQCTHQDRKERPSMDSVLQKLEKALDLLESEEAYELWKIEDALRLKELEEAYELRGLIQALVLQELLKGLELQEFEEACELQELEEALGLQKLMVTLRGHELVEAFVLEELDEAFESQKLGEILELQTNHAVVKAIQMMDNTRPTYATKEEIYTHLSTGILVAEGKVWFSVDEKGRNLEVISIMKFMHPDPNKYEAISLRESRFPMVAKILDASVVDMEVNIRTEFLSSEVTYVAYLVCKHKNSTRTDPIVAGVQYKLNDESQSYISYCGDYKDGWVMLELFQTSSRKRNVEFKVLLEYFILIVSKRVDEVIVEGIMFLPIHEFDDEITEIQQDVENPPTVGIEWENRLPSDYQQYIYYSDKMMMKKPHIYFISKTKEEAYSILSRGVYIKVDDDLEVYFWITKSNGKKCFILSPKSIQGSRFDTLETRQNLNESRFNYVLVTSPSFDDIRLSFKITNQLLSKNTKYACYLVYALAVIPRPRLCTSCYTKYDLQKQRMLKLPGGEGNLRNEHHKYDQEKLVYLSIPQSPVVGPDGEERPPTTMYKTELIEFPSKRKDGWWEVRLGEFITHNDQLTKNFRQWICTCIPCFPYVYDHSNDDGAHDATTESYMSNNANVDAYDARTILASLCLGYDPVIDIEMSWLDQISKHRGWENGRIPWMDVQGIEFRPF